MTWSPVRINVYQTERSKIVPFLSLYPSFRGRAIRYIHSENRFTTLHYIPGTVAAFFIVSPCRNLPYNEIFFPEPKKVYIPGSLWLSSLDHVQKRQFSLPLPNRDTLHDGIHQLMGDRRFFHSNQSSHETSSLNGRSKLLLQSSQQADADFTALNICTSLPA